MTISIAKRMIAFSFILTTQHATTVYETHVLSRVIYWWHEVGIIEQEKLVLMILFGLHTNVLLKLDPAHF